MTKISRGSNNCFVRIISSWKKENSSVFSKRM